MGCRTTQDLGSQKITKYWKNLKNSGGREHSTQPPSQNQILVLVVRNNAKTDIKVFTICTIVVDFVTFFAQVLLFR